MARLLTFDETVNADFVWHESHSVYDSDYARVAGVEGVIIRLERFGRTGYAFEDARCYGHAWRCWDRKPSEDERKAITWDENEHGCWDCMNYDPSKGACTLRWNNLDPSYYDPDLDDREPDEFCFEHMVDQTADWNDFFVEGS